MPSSLSPIVRALQQVDDPVFLGVLLRSLGWCALAFLALFAGSTWGVESLVAGWAGQAGWVAWLAGLLGGAAAAALAVWLFVPVAILIATLYLDRVAGAVDRRFYPGLAAPAAGAHATVQAWDGLVLGAQVAGWQVVALGLALVLPGVGFLLGWAVSGWAIGRGLFVAVAMRRMTRREALRCYAGRRWAVLLQGALLALASTVPVVNLLVPVLGVAALTHVLNDGLSRGDGVAVGRRAPAALPR